MAVFYTRADGCTFNKILLGVNGGLCLLISMVAISPCVQNRKQVFFFMVLFKLDLLGTLSLVVSPGCN